MCDTMAAVGSATAQGTVLFAKNSDRDYTEAQYLQLIPAAQHAAGETLRLTYKTIGQARATHEVLLSKPHWIWGAEIGANEHGLVIGNEAIFSKIEASLEDGIIGMDYLRLGLERAQSVDEAIHVMTMLLRQHGQSGNCGFRRTLAYHNSFILADTKTAKVLETVDREWVVSPISSYGAISNAMTIHTTFESSSPTLASRAVEAGLIPTPTDIAFDSVFADPERVASGHHRRARATALLGERTGQLQPSDFFRVLRDHVEGKPITGPTGPRICAHARENPIGQTTASWVASLDPKKIVHWVTGTAAACTGVFKPVLLELGLPAHGTRPGTEEDNTSLWWRHEQLRRRLDKSGENVLATFMQERDGLEVRFLKEIAECPAVRDDESRNRARSIVEAAWRDALAFESKWLEQTAQDARASA